MTPAQTPSILELAEKAGKRAQRQSKLGFLFHRMQCEETIAITRALKTAVEALRKRRREFTLTCVLGNAHGNAWRLLPR